MGVFLCMEYNRNRRFNFVGKGYHWSVVGTGKLTVIRIALLIPFVAGHKASVSDCNPNPVREP